MATSPTPPVHDCFIICPIGESGSETRARADALLKHVYAPVLGKHGYQALRADQVPKAGLITSQIINLVLESPLVIADLTGSNPNVFYELALRHATGKPYIQIIEAGQTIPFDISGVRTIQVNVRDLDSVESCKTEIGRYIEHFHAGHAADSPVSVAAKVRLFQDDADLIEDLVRKLDEIQGPGWTSMADLGSKLEDMDLKLDDIVSRMEDFGSKLDDQ